MLVDADPAEPAPIVSATVHHQRPATKTRVQGGTHLSFRPAYRCYRPPAYVLAIRSSTATGKLRSTSAMGKPGVSSCSVTVSSSPV